MKLPNSVSPDEVPDEPIGDPDIDEIDWRECPETGNDYNANAGMAEPHPRKCSCVLTYTFQRYGERRYCGRDGIDVFCSQHKTRNNTNMNVNEITSHGIMSKSVLHAFDKLSPWEQVFCIKIYQSYLNTSIYEFGDDTTVKTIDFSREDNDGHIPPEADDDGKVDVDVPTGDNNVPRSLPLWLAAVDGLKMVKSGLQIAIDDMEGKTVTDSELLFPNENNDLTEPEWIELEENEEHHLNLPYDRLVRSQSDLLERGGVGVDEAEETDDGPDWTMEVYGDPADRDPIGPEGFNDLESAQLPMADEPNQVPVKED